MSNAHFVSENKISGPTSAPYLSLKASLKYWPSSFLCIWVKFSKFMDKLWKFMDKFSKFMDSLCGYLNKKVLFTSSSRLW